MTWLPFYPRRPVHHFADGAGLSDCGTLPRPLGKPLASATQPECRLCRALVDRGATRPLRAPQMPVPMLAPVLAVPAARAPLVARGTFPASGFSMLGKAAEERRRG